MAELNLRDSVHTGEAVRQRLLAGLPARERQMSLAGIPTTVLESGDGPPVVLLHGPMGNATHWMRLIPELAATHRVIAPDLPGHGSSQMPADGRLDADRVLHWLGALIEQTCVTPPALIGQVLGGAIAARFAAAHGHRIKQLVLVDSFGLQKLDLPPAFGHALQDFLTRPTARTHADLWQHCAFDLDSLRRRMGDRWSLFEAYNVDRAGTPGAANATMALVEAFGTQAIAESELARIAVPSTLIWGRHDRATPLAAAERASARFGWTLHVIEDCNDDPPIEQPEALLRALHVALGRLDP